MPESRRIFPKIVHSLLNIVSIYKQISAHDVFESPDPKSFKNAMLIGEVIS